MEGTDLLRRVLGDPLTRTIVLIAASCFSVGGAYVSLKGDLTAQATATTALRESVANAQAALRESINDNRSVPIDIATLKASVVNLANSLAELKADVRDLSTGYRNSAGHPR